MATFAESIHSLATSEFDTFIEPYERDHSLLTNDAGADVFIISIQQFIFKAVKLFSFSLLKGEYVSLPTIITTLTDTKSKIESYKERTDPLLSNNLQNKILEYITAFNSLIDSYTLFLNRIQNYFSEDKIDYAFIKNKASRGLITAETNEALDYFDNLIALSNIDHFPSNEKEYISELFDIEDNIKELNTGVFEGITRNVLIKIDFLKHKWKARKFHENPELTYYLFNGATRTIEDYQGDNNKLKEWVEIIETQYELISNTWKASLKKRVKNYKNNNLSELSILQIHQLIKYNKDIKKDQNALTKYCEEVKRRLSDAVNNYDKYALGILSNYSLNNEFSLFLESSQDLASTKQKYISLKNNSEGNVNNFFATFKYLEYLSEYFILKVRKEDKLKFIDNYEVSIKSLIEKDLVEYQKEKDWSLKNHSFVFILPYQESLVPTTDLQELSSIFYASSFILPPSNRKIEEDYTKIKNAFEEIKLFVNSGKYFKSEIDKIQSLTKELDKKDFKSIEIISIFTAIITFVLSSIPTYKFIKTVAESLLFMLSLASSMSIFIILILFTTRSLYKKWQAYVVILILFSITGLGYYSLFLNQSNR